MVVNLSLNLFLFIRFFIALSFSLSASFVFPHTSFHPFLCPFL